MYKVFRKLLLQTLNRDTDNEHNNDGQKLAGTIYDTREGGDDGPAEGPQT
jgi:hypothetical protein